MVVLVEVEVIPVDDIVVVFVAVVEVIPVGVMVGGAEQPPGKSPNSLPDNSGPNGDCSNPQNRPYHK